MTGATAASSGPVVRGRETVRTFTVLGVRLWDWATDHRPDPAGLLVDVRAQAGGRAVAGTVNRSGTFVFPAVPGLWDVEHPLPGDEAGPAPAVPHLVRVRDTSGRFVTTGFSVSLPHRGAFPAAGDLAPINGTSTRFPGLPLFSAPTRRVPPGFAAIRADLRRDTGRVDPRLGRPVLAPAPFAVLRADVAGATWFGVADATGSVLLTFPFPRFEASLGTGTPGVSPSEQRTEVTLSVRFGELAAHPWLGAPVFDDLRNQPVAVVRPDPDGPAEASLVRTLTYARELVLTSRDLSVLLIEAA